MQNERKNKSKMRERTFHVCNEPVFRTGMLIIFMRTLVDKIAGSMWLVGSTGGVMLFQTHFYLILNRFLSNQKYFWEKKFLFSLSGSLTNPSRSFYAILNNIFSVIFTSVSCGTVWPWNVLPNCILLIIFWHASWWKITEKKNFFRDTQLSMFDAIIPLDQRLISFGWVLSQLDPESWNQVHNTF